MNERRVALAAIHGALPDGRVRTMMGRTAYEQPAMEVTEKEALEMVDTVALDEERESLRGMVEMVFLTARRRDAIQPGDRVEVLDAEGGRVAEASAATHVEAEVDADGREMLAVRTEAGGNRVFRGTDHLFINHLGGGR